MTRLLALPLLLLPGLAQAKPAGEALAAALVKLREAKQLDRLTRPRHLLRETKDDLVVVKLSGEASPTGLTLVSETRDLFWRRRTVVRLEFGVDGWLKRLETDSKRVGKSGERFTGVVKEGKLTLTRAGKRPRSVTVPWSKNHLLRMQAILILPALHDQGLPKTLKPEVLGSVSLLPRSKRWDWRWTTDAPTAGVGGVEVHRFQIASSLGVEVVAAGPRQGEVHATRSHGGKRVSHRTISAEAFAHYTGQEEMFAKEVQPLSLAKFALTLQAKHKKKHGAYTRKWADLVKFDRWIKPPLGKTRLTHKIRLWAPPDGSRWMLTLDPLEPGKTGERHFAANHTGKLYVSNEPFVLNKKCRVPAKARVLE